MSTRKPRPRTMTDPDMHHHSGPYAIPYATPRTGGTHGYTIRARAVAHSHPGALTRHTHQPTDAPNAEGSPIIAR